MAQEVVTTGSRNVDIVRGEDLDDFVTFSIQEQLFGIPVLGVQDILSPNNIAAIPLAPPEVTGSINLRGRIVTVIDVRVRLGLPKRAEDEERMGVTVEQQNELYTLLVDKVGDVIGLRKDDFEDNPGTLDPVWREFAQGVYRLEKQLMVVLDVERLLSITSA
jgi:purine-binding chemotaxis protein CheW